jgi:hypothetical protein
LQHEQNFKGKTNMKRQIATASKIIHAPADKIYEIIADYRTKHPLILPRPYFLDLNVEEGGVGEGTIVNFKMRILGSTQFFRSLITEPVPGRVLIETDLNSGNSTRFDLTPLESGRHTQVSISTELRNRGVVESFIAKWLLQSIYRQELERLALIVDQQTGLVLSASERAL